MIDDFASFEQLFELALINDLVEEDEVDELETDDLWKILEEHYSY